MLSVTIVCDNGAMADALSTSVMVAGLQKGSELWRKLDNFGMIVITDSNEMYISEDIEDIFEVSDDVEYTIHIIQK